MARHRFNIGIVDDADREDDETIVFRVTNLGDQSPNHTITILDDDGPPDAPAAPQLGATHGSLTSLDASWIEPGLGAAAALTGYDVQYQESGSAWNDWPHEGAGTSAVITGLAVNTPHRVRVRSLHRAEASAWSPPSNQVETGSYTVRGICSRTPRVRDRILTLLKHRHSFKGGCADVTETELAKLKSLDLRRNTSNESAFSLRLRRDDFEGLWNLVELDLADTGLRSLPAGVFDGLTDLETLNLNKNRLRSLPAGVFAGLRWLETLRLNGNSSLRTIPYDELEGLAKLTLLRVDTQGRRKLQVEGGETDATLEVRAGSSATYRLRLMSAPDSRVTASNPIVIQATSDTNGVTASGSIRFTHENWFRRQTVTVRATTGAAGATARLDHEASGTTTDSGGNAQSNYDFESYPLPGVTVEVSAPESQTSSAGSPGGAVEPLTARFEDRPAGHDGENPFTFRIAFSDDVAAGAADMRDHALTVAGGSVSGAARVDGRAYLWSFTITPSGDGDVQISLAPGRECSEAGAICTGDGRKLSSGIAGIVPKLPQPNTPATGAPTIGGTAQVGETLTASASGIADEDGLGNAGFKYQWLADDTDISGATGSSYTLADADQGRAIKVRVSFTDDAGNEETLTSTATAAVAPAPTPLTAEFLDTPASHDGRKAFTFELRFSEHFGLSYKTLRDHAFTVTVVEVTKARRLERGSNTRWEITVRPSSDGDVTIVLPITEDCEARGAICTGDGRPLSNRTRVTVVGPPAEGDESQHQQKDDGQQQKSDTEEEQGEKQEQERKKPRKKKKQPSQKEGADSNPGDNRVGPRP